MGNALVVIFSEDMYLYPNQYILLMRQQNVFSWKVLQLILLV